MTGEASAGWMDAQIQGSLAAGGDSACIADASLIWLPSALTTVHADCAFWAPTRSIVAAVSGVLRRDVAVQVDHSFRRWLIGTFRTGMGFDTYASNTTPREDERFFVSAALSLQAVARDAVAQRIAPRLAEIQHHQRGLRSQHRPDRREVAAVIHNPAALVYLVTGLAASRPRSA